MSDKELCETFGISLEYVEQEVDKVESGDYSSWDCSRVMMGSPDNERPEYEYGLLKQVEDYRAGRAKTYTPDEVRELCGLDD